MDSELNRLREQLVRLEDRVGYLEHKLGISQHSQPVQPAQAVPQVQPVLQPASVPVEIPAPAPRENWEQRIGGTWLNRLGVVALLVGLAFFLKYAFDNNWINEFGRVLLGYCTGALLLAGGFWYSGRGKLPKFGAALGGAGIGAWYISTWAASNYYHLLGGNPAFAVMIAVTAACVSLALYWDSPALAGLGLLGGYITPLLIQGVGGYYTQFVYLLILNLGALAVMARKNWNGLAFISLGFTALICGTALVNLYEKQYLVPFMLFLSAYHLLFAVQALSANLMHRSPARPPLLGVAVVSGAVFPVFYATLLGDEHKFLLAAVFLGWGLLYLTLTVAVHLWRREDKSLSVMLFSLAAAYFILAVPLRFSGAWITMVWAVMAAVLIGTGWKTGFIRARVWGMILLSLAQLRLVFWDLKLLVPVRWMSAAYAAPWADRLPALLLVLAVMLFAAWLYKGQKVTKFERGLVPLLVIGANLLALAFILGEWSRWFYYLDNGFYLGTPRRNSAWTLTMAANLALLLVIWARWKYKPLKILILVLLPVAMLWSALADVSMYEVLVGGYISPWAGRLPGAFILAGLALLAAWLFGRRKLGWLIVMANTLILSAALTEFGRYYYVFRDTLAQPWQVYRNTAWSGAMSVHGFILVATGLWRKDGLLRRLGIGLLLLTVAKITLVDLTGLETIWRILVFLGTGVLLMTASLLYQKFASDKKIQNL